MSLYVIGSPIGNQNDMSPRGIETLKTCDCIIGEEFKVLSRRLKSWGITDKELYSLNEHSRVDDIEELVDLCLNQDVALLSDCGTPGFCDPGAELVDACRRKKIKIQSIPGASSLMSFLSLCGLRVPSFYFVGFLPANKEQRLKKWKLVKKIHEPLIIMDTPYRLTRLLEELSHHFPQATCYLGTELTTETESLYKGCAKDLLKKLSGQKLEFVLMVKSRV